MKQFLWALAAIAICQPVLAGKYNPDRNIGDDAPAWTKLPGTDDKQHSLADLEKYPCVVVVFTCNSCPYAVEYEDRIIAFAKTHADKVAVVAINVNKVAEDSMPEMKKRAKEKGFPFPYLFDESQQIAKDYGAIFTPEFFVLNQDRKIVYMGALDDNSVADKVTTRYLDNAVQATLNGTTPEIAETVAVGCRVRYERSRRTRKK
jgi:peroxiredoxin